MWTLIGPIVSYTKGVPIVGLNTGGFMGTDTTRSEPQPNFAIVRTTGRIRPVHSFHADNWNSAIEKAKDEAERKTQGEYIEGRRAAIHDAESDIHDQQGNNGRNSQ